MWPQVVPTSGGAADSVGRVVVAGPVTYGGLAVGAARSACGATPHHNPIWRPPPHLGLSRSLIFFCFGLEVFPELGAEGFGGYEFEGLVVEAGETF